MFDPMTLRPRSGMEPPRFHTLNDEGKARALLICDHASNALPSSCPELGIADAKMFEHIAWDVGAAAVTRRLTVRLDTPAVLGGVSRLFVDLNRYPDDPTAIVEHSDGTHVVGNADLSDAQRAERLAWHSDYHGHVQQMIDRFGVGRSPVLLFIHSFTPRIGDHHRPWHLGVLHDGGSAESLSVLKELRDDADIVVGDNQPYSVDQPKSYSIYRHAIDRGLPYIALEVRQDLIETESQAEQWADRIADAFLAALAPGQFFGQD